MMIHRDGEQNPGSAEDFASSRSMQMRFAELTVEHLKRHPYLAASESLGRQASAMTVEIANSQPPTPDPLELELTSRS